MVRGTAAGPRRTPAARGGDRGGPCPRERALRRGANSAQRPVLAHGTPEACAGGGASGDLHAQAADADRGLAGARDRRDDVSGAAGCARYVVPSRELPPAPHERDGFPFSFWTHVEPDSDRTPTTDDCSAMLVDLHTTLRAYPSELPMLCADDVPRGLEVSDRSANFQAARDVV